MKYSTFIEKGMKLLVVLLIIFMCSCLFFIAVYYNHMYEVDSIYGDCYKEEAYLLNQYINYTSDLFNQNNCHLTGCLVMNLQLKSSEYRRNINLTDIGKISYTFTGKNLFDGSSGDLLSLNHCKVKGSDEYKIYGVTKITED